MLQEFDEMEDTRPSDSSEALIPQSNPVGRYRRSHQKKFYVQITVVLPGTIALVAPVISIFSSVGLSQIHL
jgi:hypothetical protein